MIEILISVLISLLILALVVVLVLPHTVDRHMERRVTEYVRETVIRSEQRTRDLIEHQYEAEIKPLREAIIGLADVIKEIHDDLDQLFSEGQGQKRIGIDTMFDDGVKPNPKS